MTASAEQIQIESGLAHGQERAISKTKEQFLRRAGFMGRTAVNALRGVGAGIRNSQNVLRLTAGTTMAVFAIGLGYSAAEQYAEQQIGELGQAAYEMIVGSDTETGASTEASNTRSEALAIAQSAPENPGIDSPWVHTAGAGMLSIPLLAGGSALVAGSLRDRRDNGSWIKRQTRPAALEDLSLLQADETAPQSGTIMRFQSGIYTSQPYTPYDKAAMKEGFVKRHSYNGLHWGKTDPHLGGMDTLEAIFNDPVSPSRKPSFIERVDALGDRTVAAVGRSIRAGINRARGAIAQYRERLDREAERAAFISVPDAPSGLSPIERVEWVEQQRQELFTQQALAGNTAACDIEAGRRLII